MHYLPTCPLNISNISKGADAAEPDEPEFWSRASCLQSNGGIYHRFGGSVRSTAVRQTYRSERMGGRPGPRSQHREQMTAPLFFVVGAKVATYRVQMRSPVLFEVGPKVATYDLNEISPAFWGAMPCPLQEVHFFGKMVFERF